jgi:uncharacterized membrane protein YbhN (UPF0104 family)
MKTFLKRYLKYILTAVVLIGVGMAGVKYVSGREVLAALSQFHYGYLLGMVGVSALHLLVRAWLFGVLVRNIQPLAWQTVLRVYVAGQAATLLPGGVTARAGLLHQVDVPVEKSMAPVLLISLSSQLVLLICACMTALFYPSARDTALWIMAWLGVVTLLLFIRPFRAWLMARAEGVAKRFDKGGDWRTFLESARELLTPTHIAILIALNLAAALLQVGVLELATTGLGVALPVFRLLLIYFVPVALGRLSGLPFGGIGVTDAGMVGLLAATNAVSPSTATAAVAVYRATTIFFPALVGALVYFLAWRGRHGDTAEQGG